MFPRIKIRELNDYELKLSERAGHGVYFYRVNDYNQKIRQFLNQYFEEAHSRGVVILGKIPNPDEKQLGFYEEMMGLAFQMQPAFFEQSLRKWLPRLDNAQRTNVCNSVLHTLQEMQKQGKNENMLKNAYIKFMCWFYYKFERVLNSLGKEQVPKILYEGEVSNYELKMLGILADAGCDVLLLQLRGDNAYLKLDPASKESFAYENPQKQAFPEGFCIQQLMEDAKKNAQLSRLYDPSLVKECATNTWLTGDLLADLKKTIPERGQDEKYLYNSFVRMTGVEDKATYCGELYRMRLDFQNAGRNVFVLQDLPIPTPDEISRVNRNNYTTLDQLLMDLTARIECSIDRGLECQSRKAIVELMTELDAMEPGRVSRLKNQAIYLICWFERYHKQLFAGYKKENSLNYGVFLYFGICRNGFEALFLRFLAKLPLDVVIINPDLEKKCCLTDPVLFEKKASNSLKLEKFPENANDVSYGTVAYHAEQDLTDTLYQGSGLYRNQQYKKAVPISLQTMYEEVGLLWDQETVYRPNFETLEDKVVFPVLIAKICGVKDGDVQNYWREIAKLLVEDTILIPRLPFEAVLQVNAQSATSLLKNGVLERNKIKNDRNYHYGIFREEIQDYMLDKLQELIDSRLIKGTFSQGVEYTIISVVLNLQKEYTRLIQKMDFTKKIPKLVIVATTEQQCSLSDSIVIAYLHLIGFDIAVFVPTGYQVLEGNYTKPLFVEHQIGEYQYDLRVPDLNRLSGSVHGGGIMNRLFKRGR